MAVYDSTRPLPDPLVAASLWPEADELLDLAWGVIANAGWDGLDKTEHWQESAVRWRDRYHAYLDQK